MATYGISDRTHAEDFGVFATENEAWAELNRLASIPWDREPNRCPCVSWQTCDRTYVLEIDSRTEEQRAEHERRIHELVAEDRAPHTKLRGIMQLSEQANAAGRTYIPALEIGSAGVRWLASR